MSRFLSLSKYHAQLLWLAAVMVIASACAGESPSAEAPELTVPDSMVVTDADLQRWGRPGECDGAADWVQAVRSFADAPDAALVLVDNQTAREYFDAARLDELGDLRIPAAGIDEVLSGGDASLGVAIDSDLFPELAEVLAAGGDLVLPSIAIDRQNQIAEPQQGFLALLPDGRAAWVGACGQTVTEPLNAYLAQHAATDDRATVLALLSGDESVLADYDAWYAAWSAPGPEPEAWEDQPPDFRSVDIEDTPPEVLARLGSVHTLIVLPGEWATWDVAVCGKSDLGWLGCANTTTGTTTFPMLVEPGSGFVLALLDGSARFSSRMEDLVVVDPAVLDAVIDSDQVIVFTPVQGFSDLAALRSAAATGPVFTYAVMPLDEALETFLPTEAAPTDTTVP